MTPNTVGHRLHEQRKHRGMTLRKLAEAAHTSQTTIWKIENGRTVSPSIDMVAELAKALGVGPAWLAWGIEVEIR